MDVQGKGKKAAKRLLRAGGDNSDDIDESSEEGQEDSE